MFSLCFKRYFVNNQFYQPGGPVFLMIGGEGPANPNWMVQGQWVQNYAPKHHALCVMLEHRFYGKSHPTKQVYYALCNDSHSMKLVISHVLCSIYRDLSVNSLHFLSSEQALADLATFAVNFTQTQNLGNAKWIAFGGSYPGRIIWVSLSLPELANAGSMDFFHRFIGSLDPSQVSSSYMGLSGNQCSNVCPAQLPW